MRNAKSAVLNVPVKLLQKRAVHEPQFAAAAAAASPDTLARLNGESWEPEVDFVWRTLTAMLLAPCSPSTSKLLVPPSAVAAAAKRPGCDPLCASRWLRIAPFVHPMRLIRYGDAALSLAIAAHAPTKLSSSSSSSNSSEGLLTERVPAMSKLRDAEFIESIVRAHGWDELIREGKQPQKQSQAACVSCFVSLVGAVYTEHGIDIATDLTGRLVATTF